MGNTARDQLGPDDGCGLRNGLDGAIAAMDADFARGLELIETVVGTDGALSAADKAVLIVGATSVGDRAAIDSAVRQAVGMGVTPDQIASLVPALYLSRGARPARAIWHALGQSNYPVDGRGDRNRQAPPSATIDEAVAEFTRVFGELPARVTLLRDHSPAGLEAYHRMRRAVLNDGGKLSPKLSELVLMTVNATEHRGDFAAVHARGARLAGATEPELVEAGICSIPCGGVAAWLAASEAIVATRNPDHSTAPHDPRPSNEAS